MFWFVLSIILLTCLLYSNKGIIGHNAKQLKVKGLIKAAGQWKQASNEDTDKVMALTHASYALAYLNAARSLMTDNELQVLMEFEMQPYVQKMENNYKKFASQLVQNTFSLPKTK